MLSQHFLKIDQKITPILDHNKRTLKTMSQYFLGTTTVRVFA